jgi:hypothetical protein
MANERDSLQVNNSQDDLDLLWNKFQDDLEVEISETSKQCCYNRRNFLSTLVSAGTALIAGSGLENTVNAACYQCDVPSNPCPTCNPSGNPICYQCNVPSNPCTTCNISGDSCYQCNVSNPYTS